MQTVIALGTFDGMHKGHRAVIERAVREARNTGAKAMVYTFSSIPRALFSKPPRMLMPPKERGDEIRKMGVDEVVMVPFTRDLAEMPPEAFIRMLFETYHPRAMVAGEDYSFGHKAAGNMALMNALGKEMGFETITVETIRVKMPDGSDGEKISSTDIRRALDMKDDILARNLAKGNLE